MIPVVNVSDSGIPNRLWFSRLLSLLVNHKQRRGGWVYSREDGRKGRISDYDPDFKDALVRLKASRPNLFPASLDPQRDMSLRRSGRRGSNTEATNVNLEDKYIKLVNRWRKFESRRGKVQPSQEMQAVYTQVINALRALCRYSKVL